jgi:hypothetical protein
MCPVTQQTLKIFLDYPKVLLNCLVHKEQYLLKETNMTNPQTLIDAFEKYVDARVEVKVQEFLQRMAASMTTSMETALQTEDLSVPPRLRKKAPQSERVVESAQKAKRGRPSNIGERSDRLIRFIATYKKEHRDPDATPTYDEIREALGLNSVQIRDAFEELVKQNRIRRKAEGRRKIVRITDEELV